MCAQRRNTADSKNKLGVGKARSSIRSSRKSSIWIEHLFEKNDNDLEDMPAWYHHPSRLISKADLRSNQLISLPSIVQTKVLLKQKLKDKRSTIDENFRRLRRADLCGKDLTRVTLELEAQVGDGTSQINRWICRSKSPEPKREKRFTATKLFLIRINQKCEEAMKILIEKLEKGLLPRSPVQKCDASMQYGIDPSTPTSQCDVPSQERMESGSGKSELPSGYELGSGLGEGGDGNEKGDQYCPITDEEISEYLKEPTAEYLLTKIGALDENGHLLCDLANFSQVEHCIKDLLINLATEQSSILKQNAHWEDERSESHFRRAQIRRVLRKDLRKSCGPINRSTRESHKSFRLSRGEKTERSSVVPKREQQSVGPQHVQEVVERLKSGMDRISSEEDLDSEASLLEILPFEYRESFEDDPQTGISLHPKRKSEVCRIEGIIPAQFKKSTKKTLDTCLMKNAQQLISFRQWRIRKLSQGLKGKENISKLEKRLYLSGKYFYRWLERTRLNINLERYSQCPSDSLWQGPYPLCALKLLTNQDGVSDFVPKSRKDFYTTLRKLEWQIFDDAKAVIEQEMGAD